MSLEELNSKFIYTEDKFDKWTIMKGDGPFKGDCEDYALTHIWMESGKNWFSFFKTILLMKYVLWFCKLTDGGFHMVVSHKGQFVDNRLRAYTSELPKTYKLIFPLIPPVFLVFFLLKRGWLN